MSTPGPIAAGKSWLVTTRCVARSFVMVPTDDVTAIVTYLFAEAASRYEISVHGAIAMSNHEHFVLTDVLGNLPAMLQDYHATLAQALNALHGRNGSVFARNNIVRQELVDEHAFVVALAYVAANPVAAGAVEHGRQWPGFRIKTKAMGRDGIEIRRPDCLFRHASGAYRGILPDKVTLRCDLPPTVEPERRGAFIHAVESAIGEAEAKARADILGAGRTFLGAAECKRRHPDYEATAHEAHGPSSGPDPILATDKAARREAEARLKAFHDAYRVAYAAWKSGNHDVEFPPGTWQLARYHGARVAAAGHVPARAGPDPT